MKRKFTTALIALGITSSCMLFLAPKANAATKVSLNHSSYVYTSKGKRTKSYLRKGTRVKTSGLKKINSKNYWKLSKNKYVSKKAISTRGLKDSQIYIPTVTSKTSVNIDSTKTIPSAKSVISNSSSLPKKTKYTWDSGDRPSFKPMYHDTGTIDIKYPDGSKEQAYVFYDLHGTNHIKLPAGYTADELLNAYSGSTKKLEKICDKDNNSFVSESTQDDNEKINPSKLTQSQKEEISKFAIKMINEAREQIGRPDFVYTAEAQSLADDVASEYKKDKFDPMEGHDVPALIRAAAKHGINISDNEIEDMDAADGQKPRTMTELKEEVYESICDFLFTENGDHFAHAADLLSCHGDGYPLDLESNPVMAVSYTRSHGMNADHFITTYLTK